MGQLIEPSALAVEVARGRGRGVFGSALRLRQRGAPLPKGAGGSGALIRCCSAIEPVAAGQSGARNQRRLNWAPRACRERLGRGVRAQLASNRSAGRFRIELALAGEILNSQPLLRAVMSSAVFFASPSPVAVRETHVSSPSLRRLSVTVKPPSASSRAVETSPAAGSSLRTSSRSREAAARTT